eukprot:gene4046-5788_t
MSDVTDTKSSMISLHWYGNVSSTMDEAKRLNSMPSENSAQLFAVGADYQFHGRGTRGRTWLSNDKNLFMTISMKQNLVNFPLTLLPLRVGTIIASQIYPKITSSSVVKLKWPNDVLIDDKKVCGILIEVENGNILIGIGCNVASAPSIDPKSGRSSTCIADHNEQIKSIISEAASISKDVNNVSVDVDGEQNIHLISNVQQIQHGDFHKELALEICQSFQKWLADGSDSKENIINDFQENMDYSIQKLRSPINDVTEEANAKEDVDEEEDEKLKIIPLRINSDGTLQVKYIYNNQEATLIAEYLY